MGKDNRGKELGAGYSQMKNGLYRRNYRLNGKAQAVYGATLKECRQKYQQAMQDIEAGITSKKISLDAYYDEWMKNAAGTRSLKGSSISFYKQIYSKHIQPVFGKRKAVDIKPIEIKQFQRELSERYAPKTVNSITDFLHLLYVGMLEDEVVSRNPVTVKHIKPAAGEEERVNARALNAEEKKIFLKYAKESPYYIAIKLLFATGMRTGELRALKWSDYDTKNGVLHIRRTASVDENGSLAINTPKSRAGMRNIPLNDQIVQIIEERRQERQALEGNVIAIDDYMFKSVMGKVISRNVIKSTFDIICRHIIADGIAFDRISPHACRHTFITDCLHQGMNEYVLKDIVGHAPSAKVTTDIYLGRDQEKMNEAMKDIDIAL